MEGRDIVAIHGDAVHKDHGGTGGVARATRSAVALQAARAAGLPVPLVLEHAGPLLVTSRVAGESGVHGLERDAERLLRDLGAFARALHAVEPPAGLPVADPDGVWVHGDLCPINVVVGGVESSTPGAVISVLDWEESHVGDPVVDLAWTEWLVRHLHEDRAASLPALYDGYGSTPSAVERRVAMASVLARHRRRAATPDAARVWSLRLELLGDMDLRFG